MRYPISIAARLLGISPALIRHYEQKKVISCQRQGKYRTFDHADMMALHRCQMFRKLDLGVDEIADLLNKGSTDRVSACLQQSMEEIHRKIAYEQQMLRCLERQRQLIDGLPDSLGCCTVAEVPPLRVKQARSYLQLDHNGSTDWSKPEYAPFAEVTTISHSFCSDLRQDMGFYLSIFEEDAPVTGADADADTQVLYPGTCLCSVVRLSANEFFCNEQFDFLKEAAQKQGLTLNGTLYVRYLLILKNPETAAYEAYLEAWAGIRDA